MLVPRSVEFSVRCSQSLHKIVSAVDPLILLLFFRSESPWNRLDVALEVGVAEVSVVREGQQWNRYINTRFVWTQNNTYAILYLGGYSIPSFPGGSTTL